MTFSREDDVIDEGDAEQFATLPKPLRNLDVLWAWLWTATWMIMTNEDRIGIASHSALECFSGVHH